MLYALVYVKVPQLSLRHDHQEFHQNKIPSLLYPPHLLFHYFPLSSFIVPKVILPHSRIRFETTHEYHGDRRRSRRSDPYLVSGNAEEPRRIPCYVASLLSSTSFIGVTAMTLTTTSTSLTSKGRVQSTYSSNRLLFYIPTCSV